MKPFFLKKKHHHTGKLGFYCLQQRVQTDLQKQYTDIIYKNKRASQFLKGLRVFGYSELGKKINHNYIF